MTHSFDAVVAGHICLDVIPDLSGTPRGTFEKLFVPGRLLDVGPATFSTGGAVSNTGLVLSKLGIATRLMGKVGDDLFGQAVQGIVSAYGSELAGGMVVDPAVSTSYTVVINLPGQDRIFLHCPGANDTFRAADVRFNLLKEARLLHFGYPALMRRMYEDAGAELAELFRRAKGCGVTTSLDMALPDPSSPAGRADWPAILRATLPYVDVFMPSIEEILFMLRRETYQALWEAAGSNLLPLVTPGLLSDLSAELMALGARVVGLKLGDRGLYLRTANAAALARMGRACPAEPASWADRELWTPCFQVALAGATGAGDSTIAGLLSGLLRGLPAEAALKMAVGVGACNVEAPDALSGIRTWEATATRLAAGWPMRALHLDAAGWRPAPEQGLWVGPGQA